MSIPKRTFQERVSEKDLQIEKKLQELKQLQKQRKNLESRKKEDERKRRAHRLIEIGGAVESVLGHPIEEKNIPKLIKYLRSQEDRGRYFTKAMSDEEKEETPIQAPNLRDHIEIAKKF